MKESAMKALVSDLAKAKSKQDIQGALKIYHPNAELVTVGLNAKANGLLEIETQLNIFFKVFPDYKAYITKSACNEQVLLATGNIHLTPNLPRKSCKTVEQAAAFSFEFKDNLISKEVFHLDFGQICKKAGITQRELLMTINSAATTPVILKQ